MDYDLEVDDGNQRGCEEERPVENDVTDSGFHNSTPPNLDGEEDGDEVDGEYVMYKRGSGELKEKQVFDTVEEFKDALFCYVFKEKWNVKFTLDGGEVDGEYVMDKRGSGELKEKQVFDTLEEFKDALVCYVLKEKWNVKFTLGGRVRSKAVCGIGKGCEWEIYCSYEASVTKYVVRTFKNKHTCVKNGRSKILKANVIARVFLNDVRRDPKFNAETMKEQFKKEWELEVTIDQCKKAKRRALDLIKTDLLSRLEDYKREILDTNPGSTVVFKTQPRRDDGITGDSFRFYVCFKALRETWRKWCRPIIVLNNCDLKHTKRGRLLAAVGRDSNSEVYPVAWAVVEEENYSNWVWFLQQLKKDLDLRDGGGFTIISRDWVFGVEQELPNAKHVYGINTMIHYPIKYDVKARNYSSSTTGYDVKARNYFSSTTSYDASHNNIYDSFNTDNPMRFLETLETIRRGVMVWITQRKNKAMEHEKEERKCCPVIAKLIDKEQNINGEFKILRETDEVEYEVQDAGDDESRYIVHMKNRTCENTYRHKCRRWEQCGIPCVHALKVISEKKLDYENYIPDWYSTSWWKEIYGSTINPLKARRFLRNSGSLDLIPPPTDENQGQKPTSKRIECLHESPTKKAKVH